MSEKKRKAQIVEDGRPSKKQAVSSPKSTVKVVYIPPPDVTKPVIATTPGIDLPDELIFNAYSKPGGSSSAHLLLHSSNHPMIDYSATEDVSPGEKHLKHYVAVYDPAAGKLQVTEATRMTIRSSVRQPDRIEEEGDVENGNPTSNYSARAALTHAFGTKNSKKAVQSIAENALLSRGSEKSGDPHSAALLSSMPARDQAEDQKELETSTQANKPLPTPDLTTPDITGVYPFSSLVFPAPPAATLAKMPIKDWMEQIGSNKGINCVSRFVASRVTGVVKAALANPDPPLAKQPVQLMRYMLLLIELYHIVRPVRSERRLPPASKLASQVTGPVSSTLLERIVEHFCPNGLGLSKAGATLLQTTILALTLHIPPPSGDHGPNVLITEPTDIQQDLNLKPDEARSLYRELGCRWESATEAELTRWGYVRKFTKIPAAQRPKFAKLKLPLDFPQLSRGPAGNSKRRG